jgi:hypothetical protein
MVLIAMAGLPSAAGAAGYCNLPDGSMGRQCVVSTSGQVYGCVKDLKDCGALSPVQPSGGAVSRPADDAGAPLADPAAARQINKSKSNVKNN